MITKIDNEKLSGLIKPFYNLTGIKVAVYDSDFSELFAYPAHNTVFCTLMYKNDNTRKQCIRSTQKLCTQCMRENRVIIEKCHAGLTEAIAPLVDGVSVIGYIMFGQVTNEADRALFCENVMDRCSAYRLGRDALQAALDGILCYSDEQLDDASKILNALAVSIVYHKIVYSAETSAAQMIVDYIRANLSKKLTVKELCAEFYLSKSEIYKLTKGYMPEGIAAFVRQERLEKAAQLLRSTNKSNWEIAAETGFSDVDYFLRSFKAAKGISAGKYREKL